MYLCLEQMFYFKLIMFERQINVILNLQKGRINDFGFQLFDVLNRMLTGSKCLRNQSTAISYHSLFFYVVYFYSLPSFWTNFWPVFTFYLRIYSILTPFLMNALSHFSHLHTYMPLIVAWLICRRKYKITARRTGHTKVENTKYFRFKPLNKQ